MKLNNSSEMSHYSGNNTPPLKSSNGVRIARTLPAMPPLLVKMANALNLSPQVISTAAEASTAKHSLSVQPPSPKIAIPVPTEIPAEDQNIYAADPSSRHIVIFPFKPTRSDEILLHVGDEVVLQKVFCDNWAVGVNIVKRIRGFFPVGSVYTLQGVDRSRNRLELLADAVSRILEESDSVPSTIQRSSHLPSPHDKSPSPLSLQPLSLNIANSPSSSSPSTYIGSPSSGLTAIKEEEQEHSSCGTDTDSFSFVVGDDSSPISKNEDTLCRSPKRSNHSNEAINSESAHIIEKAPAPLNSVATICPIYTPNTEYLVEKEFKSERPDELELRPGDRVQLARSLETEGWGIGSLVGTNEFGFFSLEVLGGSI